MSLISERKKDHCVKTNMSLPMRLFVQILLLHIVVMYMCSWYVEYHRMRTRRIQEISKTTAGLSVKSLPILATQGGLKAIRTDIYGNRI
jgi:hypothetical protein